jgi:hypothetical protein
MHLGAAILEGPTEVTGRMIGTNRVPGNSEAQSSYRGELRGIMYMLSLVQCVMAVHDIKYGHVRIGLDGEKAMQEASGTNPLLSFQKSFDLRMEIQHIVRTLPVQITFSGWRAIKWSDTERILILEN